MTSRDTTPPDATPPTTVPPVVPAPTPVAPSAPTPAPPTTLAADVPPEQAPKVRGVGDSVFHSAESRTVAALRPEYRPSFLSVLGASIAEMTPTAQRMVARRPAVMVLGLANPDVALMADPTWGWLPYQWAEDLLDTTESVPCVVWVNLKEHGVNPYYTPRWEQEARSFNRWLRGAARGGGRLYYPNFHVVDWNAATVGHPSWFLEDGLHLKPTGQVSYAAKIDRTLNRICPP